MIRRRVSGKSIQRFRGGATIPRFPQIQERWTTLGFLGLSLLLAVGVFRLHEVPGNILMGFKLGIVSILFGLGTALASSTPYRISGLLKDRLARAFVIFMGWGAVSTVFSIYRGQSIEAMQSMLPTAAMIVVYALIPPSTVSLRTLVRLHAILGGLLGLGALVLGNASGGRLQVTATLDPNDLGAVMAMTVPLLIALARFERGAFRIFAILLIPVCLFALLETGSRGSTIGMTVGLVVLFYFAPRKAKIQLGTVAAIGLPILLMNAPTAWKDRMLTLSSLEEDYNMNLYGGRTKIWKRGIGYTLENPIVGVGPGNFTTAEGYYLDEQGLHGRWNPPHSTYIEVSAEMGLVGFMLFGALLFEAHRKLLRKGQPIKFRAELLAASAAFFASAAFLGLARFSGLYALIALLHFAGQTGATSPTTKRL